YLLAPIFLWPVKIELDRRHQGRYAVSRNREIGPPQFNRAMAAWIRNKLQLDLTAPSENDMGDLIWEKLPEHLQNLANGFRRSPTGDCEGALDSVPTPMALLPQQSPRFFNCAVLGNFRWQNEAILADLEAIKDQLECHVPVVGFVTGNPFEKSRQE